MDQKLLEFFFLTEDLITVKKACGPKIVSCGIDSKEDKAKVEIPTAVEIAAV